MRLYWVKDNDQPVDCLPSFSERERYLDLYSKALKERDEASKGVSPYNVDVLYGFWSHFLLRNFNTTMYNDFRRLAVDDFENRESVAGFKALLKYYKEALSNENHSIRTRVAWHYVDLAKRDLENEDAGRRTDKLAFKQLKNQWRDGATSLRNRKVLGEFVDDELRTTLDAPSER
ncbi:hypothetical protein NA57DRAFT_45965 [Rhizodiscina lignyota]|uniref:Uncharacterized protein n=1 Tax=Rhizodiscina lignyota TaxID=1504668 RepID=A0A9P4M2Q3_9PEZI|nr:hypothetical protein NA57DRAFT_45965 [Rhizodiscina lignyota]